MQGIRGRMIKQELKFYICGYQQIIYITIALDEQSHRSIDLIFLYKVLWFLFSILATLVRNHIHLVYSPHILLIPEILAYSQKYWYFRQFLAYMFFCNGVQSMDFVYEQKNKKWKEKRNLETKELTMEDSTQMVNLSFSESAHVRTVVHLLSEL